MLLVSEPLSGGVGQHVVDLAQGLTQSGHEVHLIYSSLRVTASSSKRLEGLPKIQRMELPIRRNPHASDLAAVCAIRRYMNRHRCFDVVHGHSSKGGALVRLAGVGTHAVKVYTPNAFVTLTPDLDELKRWLFGGAERWLARLGDGVIVVSQNEYEHAVRLGLPSNRLFLVPNGINPPFYESKEKVRRELGIEHDALCMGFVGRLADQKAPDVLIRAFALVVKKHPRACLVMVGSGPLEAQTRDLANQLGVQDRIHWLGERDGWHCMPAFDIFSLTSRYEGLPYVLLEALGCALPIVTTRVGGTSELIEDQVNGFVVDVDDVDGFAQAVEQLFNDPALRKRMSQSSKEKSCDFTLSRMVCKTVEVYRQLIAQRRV